MKRRAFTLVELMITMAIIVVLAMLVAVTMGSAEEAARVSHTRALIARIHTLLMDRYESYRWRRLGIENGTGNTNQPEMTAANAAALRCRALRELMRLEMPDRFTDVADHPVTTYYVPGQTTSVQIPRPTVSVEYLQVLENAKIILGNATGGSVSSTINTTYQGADCLFLVVTMGLEENDVLENFQQADVGVDPNNPGMQCFMDSWGNPIQFLRWAPGFNSPLQPMNVAANEWSTDPDQTDPTGVYGKTYANGGRITGTVGGNPPPLSFALFPLVYSAGPDGFYDVVSDTATPLHYAQYQNNPFVNIGSTAASTLPIGTPSISASNTTGSLGSFDNVTSHAIGQH